MNKHWVVTFRKDLGYYDGYGIDYGLVGIYDTKEQALAKMNELTSVKNKHDDDEPVYDVLQLETDKPTTLFNHR